MKAHSLQTGFVAATCFFLIFAVSSLVAESEKNMKIKVEHAVAKLKAGDQTEFLALKENLNEALPYLINILNGALGPERADIAAIVGQSGDPDVIAVLYRLIGDADPLLTKIVITTLFRNFSISQLRIALSDASPNRIVAELSRNPLDPKVILISGCFKDPSAIKAVGEARDKAQGEAKLEHWVKPVPTALFYDIALANSENSSAVERLKNALLERKLEDVTVLALCLRYISQREVAESCLKLLDDTRDCLPRGPSHSEDYLRVCDVASAEWEQLLGNKRPTEAPAKRFEDKERIDLRRHVEEKFSVQSK